MPTNPITKPTLLFSYPNGNARFATTWEHTIKSSKPTQTIGRKVKRATADYVNELRANSPVASGRLKRGWQHYTEVKRVSNGIRLFIRINNRAKNSYFRIVGRAPGKVPPIKPLTTWCRHKRLPPSVAYAISKRIARDGTERYRTGQNIVGINPKTHTYNSDGSLIRFLLRLVNSL